MIYLDNAATGGFKPQAVLDSVCTVIKYLSANPGRSSHRLSIAGQKIISSARNKLADLFNADSDRVIFTKNCTEALNLSIFSLAKSNKKVITTIYEHNSVLRPLYNLSEQGKITLDIVSPTDIPLEKEIENRITDNTSLIVTTSVSNVTGDILPFRKIGEVAKKYNIPYIVDGAQGGGHIPIDLKKDNISALALASHKGLYGIMGSGVLIFDKNTTIYPLIFGGTGTETFNLPTTYPEMLECGTVNLPAISALLESVDYVKTNITNFGDCLLKYTERVYNALSQNKKITCYFKPNRAGITAFNIEGLSSQDVADILNREYDIAVRGGYHCAPLIHDFLTTKEKGVVRASFATQNSSSEISAFIHAINRISNS